MRRRVSCKRNGWSPPATAAALIGVLALAAAAAAAPQMGVPHDVPGLVALLTGAELTATPLDSTSFVLTDGVMQVIVFVEDGGRSLQAVLPYRGPEAADPSRLASWNATRRFSRAYADERGAAVLASDLALGPGTGPAAVTDWAALVLALANRFRVEVWPPAGPPREPISE